MEEMQREEYSISTKPGVLSGSIGNTQLIQSPLRTVNKITSEFVAGLDLLHSVQISKILKFPRCLFLKPAGFCCETVLGDISIF